MNCTKHIKNPVIASLRRLSLALLAVAAVTTGAIAAADEKTITVTSTSEQASLEFDFHPVKPSFDVTEPLEFSLRANQDIFLYVYTVTSDGDYALILPNHVQTQNKYPANTTLTVPNRNVAFIADGSVAEEPVYAIASTRYIELDIAKQRKFGDFAMIGGDDMQERFGEKGIILRDIEAGESQTQLVTEAEPDASTGNAANAVVAEASLVRVDVAIENHHATPAATPTAVESDPVITFVSTDQVSYDRGDTVHILFGASEAGTVELYLIDPDGSGGESPILTREVDGKGYQRVSAIHDGTTGSHTIRAVYKAPEGAAKGLRLNLPTEPAADIGRSVQINID